MGEWIKKLFTNYLAGWLIVITPLIAGFLAWVQSLPYYVIALATLIAFGAVFWGINQFHTFRERRKKGIASLNDQEIENTIRNWLDVPYLSVERKVHSDKFFQFDVTGKHGIPVTVERLRSDPYRFNLGVRVTWKEEDKVKLRNLRESICINLIRNLKVEMLRMGIQFQMEGQIFNEILLLEQIALDDSLSSFYFLQRIFFVVRAASLIGAIIESTLIESSSSELTPDREDSQTE